MRHNPPEFDDEDGICRQQDAQSTSQQEQKYLQEATTSKMCERVFPRGHDRRGQKGHNHHELDAHTYQADNTHREAQRTWLQLHVQSRGPSCQGRAGPYYSRRGCCKAAPGQEVVVLEDEVDVEDVVVEDVLVDKVVVDDVDVEELLVDEVQVLEGDVDVEDVDGDDVLVDEVEPQEGEVDEVQGEEGDVREEEVEVDTVDVDDGLVDDPEVGDVDVEEQLRVLLLVALVDDVEVDELEVDAVVVDEVLVLELHVNGLRLTWS